MRTQFSYFVCQKGCMLSFKLSFSTSYYFNKIIQVKVLALIYSKISYLLH